MDDIIKDKNSADIIAFFFALENNNTAKEKKIKHFNKYLCNDESLKIVFIIFYAAIMYHLAKLMCSLKLSPPSYITFSGTGSKVISIIDSDQSLETLRPFTKLIFEKVYDKEIKELDLQRSNNPKEITCKGGLLCLDDPIKESKKKVHLGGTSENGKDNYNLKYKDISEEKFEDIVTEVENFIELIFNLNKDFNFTNNFGISIPLIKKSKTILKKDLMQYLKTGFALKEKELSVDKDLAIEESLFFYPLVGALNKLAYEITKSK